MQPGELSGQPALGPGQKEEEVEEREKEEVEEV